MLHGAPDLPTARPLAVVATTPLEVAEVRLAAVLRRLAAAVADELPQRAPRARVLQAERRVRTLRALPVRRVARGATDVRLDVAAAYGRLAAVCHRLGLEDDCAAALGLAAAERRAARGSRAEVVLRPPVPGSAAAGRRLGAVRGPRGAGRCGAPGPSRDRRPTRTPVLAAGVRA
ncbi:hypothetical protein SK069_16310 [Patulibacter brassicae]|uniref:DUF222 domain-containing protein n=1 Tax=Patulibacter brassicae TaxID=1705717 RepID=A0ABU4VMT9_9ACTN|nr:hypothetical protein [Patulibacter brassicae]MDX8153162.1 hypothetical protein [Patulibacter brassicae]